MIGWAAGLLAAAAGVRAPGPARATTSGSRPSSSCSSPTAVGVAAVGGAGPGIVAAVSGFLLANWFFTPPIHTWTVAEAEQVLALTVFLAVAGLVSAYVALSARRSRRGEAGTGRGGGPGPAGGG